MCADSGDFAVNMADWQLPPLAQDGWGLATWVVIAFVVMCFLGIPWTLQHFDLKAIRHQTENSHDTNLRDDIDEIREMVRDGMADIRSDISGIRKDIGGLRGELRTEREERIESDARIWRGPWKA